MENPQWQKQRIFRFAPFCIVLLVKAVTSWGESMKHSYLLGATVDSAARFLGPLSKGKWCLLFFPLVFSRFEQPNKFWMWANLDRSVFFLMLINCSDPINQSNASRWWPPSKWVSYGFNWGSPEVHHFGNRWFEGKKVQDNCISQSHPEN